MTPARRAALRKAQLASARKRRRRDVAKKVGNGAVKLGSAFVSIQAARYMANPRAIGKDYADAKSTIKRHRAKRYAKKNPPPPKAASTHSVRHYQYGPWV
jgi:hypothetical protein